MEIGKEEEKKTIEPVINPVPTREPAQPAPPSPVKQPDKEPVKV